MRIIVDSNIIFSALLKENTVFREILQNDENQIFAPSKLLSEIIAHENKILKYTKIDKSRFYEFFLQIISNITFVDEKLIPIESYNKAYELCKEYDVNDIPFIALSLHLNALLWTGDKIKGHLFKLGFNHFFEY